MPRITTYRLAPLVTAFSTTRLGGCTATGAYSSFNVNRHCGDSPAATAENRRALCRMLAISDDCLIFPHQVHGKSIARINAPMTQQQQADALEGYDALMTDRPGLCIGVSTADCIPILLYDQRHHAASAIHAGWRGTQQRIALAALEAMHAAYGTQPADIVAQIGPGISLESFEVGDEVYDAFSTADFDMEAIARRQGQHAKWHIDLPKCNAMQIAEAGVPQEAIADARICTYNNADAYFSARRLGIQSGRILTAIILSRPQ